MDRNRIIADVGKAALVSDLHLAEGSPAAQIATGSYFHWDYEHVNP